MRALIPAIVVLSIVAASPVNGQEFDLRGAGIPGDVATRIQRILEDSRTKRLEGVASIGQGAVSDGSVVASNGSITVAGNKTHGHTPQPRASRRFPCRPASWRAAWLSAPTVRPTRPRNNFADDTFP